ncbi:MAG: hypothetical protein WCG08_05840 [Paludibacter sp.]|jgi:hypothetical protein
MKTTRLFFTAIAVFLSSFCIAFAANANVATNDSSTNLISTKQKTDSTTLVQSSNTVSLASQQQLDEITSPMLDALQTTVSLTSIQLETIKKKTDEYAANLLKAKSMSNKEDSYAFMSLVTQEYQAMIERTLTSDQKAQRAKKIKDQIDNQYKKSNKK